MLSDDCLCSFVILNRFLHFSYDFFMCLSVCLDAVLKCFYDFPLTFFRDVHLILIIAFGDELKPPLLSYQFDY